VSAISSENQLADHPAVTVLIAAHNEEGDIEARILNALALNYPADKLEIAIASDGSTDGTNDIVRRYAERYRDRVKLFAYETNRGKATRLLASIAYKTRQSSTLGRNAMEMY